MKQLPSFLCTKSLSFDPQDEAVTSAQKVSKSVSLSCTELLSMVPTVIIGFFQQFFNANCDDECPNSPPKAWNDIANICVFVDRRMISPRFKSCPGIFPDFNFFSSAIHCFEGGENKPISSSIFALSSNSSSLEKLRLATKPVLAYGIALCHGISDGDVNIRRLRS